MKVYKIMPDTPPQHKILATRQKCKTLSIGAQVPRFSKKRSMTPLNVERLSAVRLRKGQDAVSRRHLCNDTAGYLNGAENSVSLIAIQEQSAQLACIRRAVYVPNMFENA